MSKARDLANFGDDISDGVISAALDGDGSALSNLPIPASGEKEFIATGTLSTGDTVGLNSDGTVSLIKPVVVGTTSIPLSSSSWNGSYTHYDKDSQTILFAYGLNGSNLYLVAGTISNNTITFGSTVTVASNCYTSHGIPIGFNRSGGYSAIIYKLNGNTNTVYVRPFLVTGNSISLGSTGSFSTTYGYSFKAQMDDANGLLITWAEATSPYGRRALAVQVTSSISYGGIYTVSEFVDSLSYSSTSDVFLARISNGDTQIHQVITLSGTGLSFGQTVQTTDLTTSPSYWVFIDDLNCAVYYNPTLDAAYIVTLSGSSVSVGSKITDALGGPFDSCKFFPYTGSTFIASVEKSGKTELLFVDVSGNSLTVSTRITVPYTYANICLTPDTGSLFNIGSAITELDPSGKSTESFIGFASADALDGESVSVKVIGGVVEGLSGLTTGKQYGFKNNFDNTLVEDNLTSIGVSISSDKLLLTGSVFGTDHTEELADVPWVAGTSISATNLDLSKYRFVFVLFTVNASDYTSARINSVYVTTYVSNTTGYALFGKNIPGVLSLPPSSSISLEGPTSTTIPFKSNTTSISLYHQYMTNGRIRVWGIR